jgi:hypothetical protein
VRTRERKERERDYERARENERELVREAALEELGDRLRCGGVRAFVR